MSTTIEPAGGASLEPLMVKAPPVDPDPGVATSAPVWAVSDTSESPKPSPASVPDKSAEAANAVLNLFPESASEETMRFLPLSM